MKTKRYDGEEGSEVTEDVSSTEDYGNEDKRTSDAAGVAPSGKKPKVVTKEELGGMSLRDYLNKQQGLTRRKDTASEKRPTRPGQDTSAYSNEGRRSSVTKGNAVSRSSGNIAQSMGVNSKTLLPTRMAAGGSASSRADGIAQRGKTKGKMC
jgi:hypothetical protein